MVAGSGKMVPLPKVVIEVRYKDKTGQWNGTNSLSLNDIPKAILALQKAFEYLTGHKKSLTPRKTHQQAPNELTSSMPPVSRSERSTIFGEPA
jgi:hypothetical protein